VDIARLEEKGGFTFNGIKADAAPRAEWSPVLVRPAPWKTGDFVHVATAAYPVGAEGGVHFRALHEGAAALLMEPDGRKAYVWIANLTRHYRQYMMDVPAGAKVRTYKRDVEMPPVPPGEPANAGLSGAESAVWVLESGQPLDAKALLNGLRAGKGRTGEPPATK
jgi:hypothetical protein